MHKSMSLAVALVTEEMLLSKIRETPPGDELELLSEYELPEVQGRIKSLWGDSTSDEQDEAVKWYGKYLELEYRNERRLADTEPVPDFPNVEDDFQV